MVPAAPVDCGITDPAGPRVGVGQTAAEDLTQRGFQFLEPSLLFCRDPAAKECLG